MPTHGASKPQKNNLIKNVTLYDFYINTTLTLRPTQVLLYNRLAKVSQELKKTNFLHD